MTDPTPVDDAAARPATSRLGSVIATLGSQFHELRTRQRVLWLAALVTGIIVGYAALAFRAGLVMVESLFLGAQDEDLLTAIAALPGWQIVALPALGGLAVGIILQVVMRRERPLGIADVIEASALRGAHLPLRPALTNSVLSIVSLGCGASTGREGPVVHLGAAFGSAAARLMRLPARHGRVMLGCCAAAVAASFNAPIAGVLFAHEVILRHYAVSAFAPIATASVAGAVVTRLHLGSEPAFDLVDYGGVSYLEFPAFAALGLIAGAVATAFLFTLKRTDEAACKLPLPIWIRPMLGGVVIGVIALQVPEILGVGYGAVDRALREEYGALALLTLIAAKIVATSVSLASRFGGGVFSPSLYLGAMAGGLFGTGLGILFPDQTTGYGFYAIVGMGAVAAAVLRAPISTTLIVFELTGDYAMTIALLVSASIATVTNQSVFKVGFFEWQLLSRGIDLTKGTYTTVLQTTRVIDFMDWTTDPDETVDENAPVLYPQSSLQAALQRLEDNDLDSIPVVDRTAPTVVIGRVTYKRALEVYNRALINTNIEEHQ